MKLLASLRDALLLIVGLLLLLAAVGLIISLPDIARYLRVRSM